MTTSYLSTRDLSERFRCTSRTLFRRMRRARNPFPAPCIRHAGSCNLWDASEVAAWEQRERERERTTTRALPLQIGRAAYKLVTSDSTLEAHSE